MSKTKYLKLYKTLLNQ